MLTAYIPYFEITLGESYCSDVLADCGDGFEVWVVGSAGGGVYGEGFYVFEEGCFAGVVKAEEED